MYCPHHSLMSTWKLCHFHSVFWHYKAFKVVNAPIILVQLTRTRCAMCQLCTWLCTYIKQNPNIACQLTFMYIFFPECLLSLFVYLSLPLPGWLPWWHWRPLLFFVGISRCGPNGFECRNLMCVSLTQKCNGFDECGDNSDEIGCNGMYSNC